VSQLLLNAVLLYISLLEFDRFSGAVSRPDRGRAEVFGLVYRLLNPLSLAAGQLAVFQGASEVPISVSYGSSEQRGKTANWPRPGGLR
jgi:hypothetical protein